MENVLKVINVLKVENVLEVENVLKVEKVLEVENVLMVENVLKVKNVLEVENVLGVENILGLENVLEVENVLGVENILGLENILDVGNVLDLDYVLDMEICTSWTKWTSKWIIQCCFYYFVCFFFSLSNVYVSFFIFPFARSPCSKGFWLRLVSWNLRGVKKYDSFRLTMVSLKLYLHIWTWFRWNNIQFRVVTNLGVQ